MDVKGPYEGMFAVKVAAPSQQDKSFYSSDELPYPTGCVGFVSSAGDKPYSSNGAGMLDYTNCAHFADGYWALMKGSSFGSDSIKVHATPELIEVIEGFSFDDFDDDSYADAGRFQVA